RAPSGPGTSSSPPTPITGVTRRARTTPSISSSSFTGSTSRGVGGAGPMLAGGPAGRIPSARSQDRLPADRPPRAGAAPGGVLAGNTGPVPARPAVKVRGPGPAGAPFKAALSPVKPTSSGESSDGASSAPGTTSRGGLVTTGGPDEGVPEPPEPGAEPPEE